ncbi:hypothetical protein RND71_005377 [Anisodus tanguticus]|uniref:WRKY domain-containing protein n=1 Tax=Anisodus tanguticus TaxID=243964 RepID=A0AAE1SRD7_9SOLA|nr:hypothetical protein RND71_005377 [Anisodus tanguticus]
MEFTSLVDTSLDLSFRPRPVLDKVPKQEVQSDFTGLSRDMNDAEDLLEELNRVSSENKKLTEMLTVVCENYNALRNQLMEYMSSSQNGVADDSAGSRKRKAESTSNPNNKNNNLDVVHARSSESSSSDEESCYKKLKEENIKAKVQRSIEDQSIVVATYEGEHNHSKQEAGASTNTNSTASRLNVTTIAGSTASVPCSTTLNPSGPTITLDLTEPKTVGKRNTKNHSTSPTGGNSFKTTPGGEYQNRPEIQQFLIEQMATSLTKDPSFKAALAAAISGKILQHNNQTR